MPEIVPCENAENREVTSEIYIAMIECIYDRGHTAVLYICFELSVHRVAGKRPAPENSDRLEGICRGWAALPPTRSKKPHLEKVPYARGVCKKLPISGHSGAG
jgi:hypothetical protein